MSQHKGRRYKTLTSNTLRKSNVPVSIFLVTASSCRPNRVFRPVVVLAQNSVAR